ncbi:hypothetical protein FACS1894164_09280 [Spirochaetia bacterium]|nr:hypothetical protein FACS1894164_09280 [Spirochaetia bacterium]
MRCLAGIFCALCISTHVCAGSKPETKTQTPVSTEWILCITAFDVSALPTADQGIGYLAARNLVQPLNRIPHRIRPSQEFAFYQSAARSSARSAASQAIVQKRQARDQLIFEGKPEWQYRRDLKEMESALTDLEQALKKVDRDPIRVEARPAFHLAPGNLEGTFPDPPRSGDEANFCTTHKADALLTGTIRPLQGRFVLTVRLWILGIGAFVYEDRIVFSAEDVAEASHELSIPLIAELSGESPAGLIVRSTPADATIAVNGVLTESGLEQDLPAGPVAVEVSAPGYETQNVTLDLFPDQLSALSLDLRPQDTFNFTFQTAAPAQVYDGSRYSGETPLSLTLPQGQYEYLYFERLDGRQTAVVFDGTNPPATDSMVLPLRIPSASPKDDLELRRRKFYNSFGRFWFALPVAFFINGLSSAQATAGNLFPGSVAKNPALTYTSIGAWILFGLSAADMLYQTFRYINSSGQGAAALVGK